MGTGAGASHGANICFKYLIKNSFAREEWKALLLHGEPDPSYAKDL